MMRPTSRVSGFLVDVGSTEPVPTDSDDFHQQGSPARTVKVPRRVWTIAQQVFEGNLLEFGLSPEVAELATSYSRYCNDLLSHKGANMIAVPFQWADTEEGTAYWKEVYKQARIIEEMWNMLTKEDPE